jgi:hypothetical protein
MREGPAEHWVREDLMMLLAPYRRGAEAQTVASPTPAAPARPRRRGRRPSKGPV